MCCFVGNACLKQPPFNGTNRIIPPQKNQVGDARGESDSLRRLLRLKTRELKTLRRLGQEVLLQRSEVEVFLIAALQQVRAELARERAGVHGGAGTAGQEEGADSGGGGSGQLAESGSHEAAAVAEAAAGAATEDGTAAGAVGEVGAAQEGHTMGSSPLDIRDLTWEQRERVLWLLFSRISAHAVAGATTGAAAAAAAGGDAAGS
jgi:hypothetical protein